MSGTAKIHDAVLKPSKLELLAGWLPNQPWFDGDAGDLRRVAAYRFVAPDGRQAVTRLTQAADASFDAVLMDVQMPVMNGYEAAKAIRESGVPEIQDVPIVAMTANAFAEDRARCFQAGMNDFIPKPVEPDLLLQVVLKWLERHLRGL